MLYSLSKIVPVKCSLFLVFVFIMINESTFNISASDVALGSFLCEHWLMLHSLISFCRGLWLAPQGAWDYAPLTCPGISAVANYTVLLVPEMARSRTSGHQNSSICKNCSTPCASLEQKSHKR